MDRSLPILIVLCSTALPARAQNSTSPGAQAVANSTSAATASAAADTSRIIFAKNPDVDAPNPDAGLDPVGTPLSANLHGELAEGAPRYQPPVPASGVDPDQRATDKPKNEIPRLPVSTMSRYLVKGTRAEVFEGRDLYTTEGLIDLSFKAHPGLRAGNLFNLNAGAAYQAFLDQERLAKMDDLQDTARAIAAGGDAAEAEAIQDAAAQAYMRTEDVEGPVGIK